MRPPPIFALLPIVALPVSAILAAESEDWPRPIYSQASAYGGDPTGIEIVDDRLYLSTLSTIAAFDISDRSAIKFLGASLTTGSTQRMTVAGENAFLVGYHADLDVYDLSDPAGGMPRVGGYKIDGSASMVGVGVSGDRVFVSGNGTGLIVLDVSSPTDPQVIAEVAHDQGATQDFAGEHIRVAGGLIYLAGHDDDFGALTVYRDIPGGEPEFVGDYLAPSNGVGSMPRIEINGGVAYGVDTGRGIQVFDISDPTAPKLIAQPGPRPTRLEDLGSDDIALSGNRLVSVDAGRFTVLDISVATTLVVGGDLPLISAEQDLRMMVTVSGTTAYVADRHNLYAVDFSDIDAPILIGALALSGRQTQDVAVVGDLAYAADGGLGVYDVTDPAAPVEVGRDGVSAYRSIAVDGNRVAAWSASRSDIHLYDLGVDGRVPTLRSELRLENFSRFDFEGNRLWVQHPNEGLFTYAVFDIDRPGQSGSLSNLDEAIGYFRVEGTTLYASSGQLGLKMYDVTIPSAPSLLGSLGGNPPAHFVIDGSLLYGERTSQETGEAEVVIVDVSDPSEPRFVGALLLSGDGVSAVDMSVANGFLFVSRGYSTPNALIIDVSVPSRPRLVEASFGEGTIDRLEARDGLLYLAHGFLGLQVFDTSLELPTFGIDRDLGLTWDAPEGVVFPIEGSRDLLNWLPLGRWAGDTLGEAIGQMPGEAAYIRATQR